MKEYRIIKVELVGKLDKFKVQAKSTFGWKDIKLDSVPDTIETIICDALDSAWFATIEDARKAIAADRSVRSYGTPGNPMPVMQVVESYLND